MWDAPEIIPERHREACERLECIVVNFCTGGGGSVCVEICSLGVMFGVG